ncbi:MAG: hypothetical protein FWB88_09555 [Defluviitaleaceae bacterium]|nr:hypothetical protein [Defluviitaleaceae bacterium]MCL2239703.1 hypothetical protein [Defluviitaleaceae bacterium]
MQLSKRFKLLAVVMLAFVALTAMSAITVQAFTRDFINERVTGIPANTEFQVGTGRWVPVMGTYVDVTPGTTIRFRLIDTTAITHEWAAPARPANPAVTPANLGVNFAAETMNLPATLQIRTTGNPGTNATWSAWRTGGAAFSIAPFFQATALPAGSVQVRTAPTTSSFASNPVAVSHAAGGALPARRGAPNPASGAAANTIIGRWNAANQTITGIYTGAQIRFQTNDVNAATPTWTAWQTGSGARVQDAVIIPRTAIGGDTNRASRAEIRRVATGAAPHSLSRFVDIPAQAANPPRVGGAAIPALTGIPVGTGAADGLVINFLTETLMTHPGPTASLQTLDMMEWRRAGTEAWTAIPAGTTALNITPIIPAANAAGPVILQVRFAAYAGSDTTDPRSASGFVELTLPRRPATPLAVNHAFSGATMQIPTVAGQQFFNRTTGEWEAVAATPVPIDVALTPTTAFAYQLRTAPANHTGAAPATGLPGTAATFASTPLSINIPARAAAPRPVYNVITDLVTGVTAAMEFSFTPAVADSWVPITGTTLNRAQHFRTPPTPLPTPFPVDMLHPERTTMYVRVRGTGTARPSNEATVVISPVSTTNAAAPVVTIDFINEVLLHPDADVNWTLLEWRRIGEANWRNIPAAGLELSAHIPAPTAANPLVIEVRYRAIQEWGITTPPSPITSLTLNQRPAPPSTAAGAGVNRVLFNGLTNTISVNDTMQYRSPTVVTPAGTDNDPPAVLVRAAWHTIDVGVTAIEVNTDVYGAIIYYVRIAPNEGVQRFGSANLRITVPARPGVPGGTAGLRFVPASDGFDGVTTAMEWTLDATDGPWFNVVGTTLTRAQVRAAAPAFNDGTVYVRRRATATARYSLNATPEFPTLEDAPVVTSNWVTERLNGTTTDMQFRRVGFGADTAWTNITTANVTAGGPAIGALIPAATAVPNNGTHGYIEVRLRANVGVNAGNPASTPTRIRLYPRPATPVQGTVPTATITTGTYFRLDGRTETIMMDRASGLQVAHGATGTNWNDITGASFDINIAHDCANDNPPVPAIADASRVYRFRVAPTDTRAASQPFNVTVAARVAAPGTGVRWNGPTAAIPRGHVSGLNVNMEIAGAGTSLPNTGAATTPAEAVTTGDWVRVPSGTNALHAGQLTNAGGPVFVRFAGTPTVRASLIRTVTVPAAPGSMASFDHIPSGWDAIGTEAPVAPVEVPPTTPVYQQPPVNDVPPVDIPPSAPDSGFDAGLPDDDF